MFWTQQRSMAMRRQPSIATVNKRVSSTSCADGSSNNNNNTRNYPHGVGSNLPYGIYGTVIGIPTSITNAILLLILVGMTEEWGLTDTSITLILSIRIVIVFSKSGIVDDERLMQGRRRRKKMATCKQRQWMILHEMKLLLQRRSNQDPSLFEWSYTHVGKYCVCYGMAFIRHSKDWSFQIIPNHRHHHPMLRSDTTEFNSRPMMSWNVSLCCTSEWKSVLGRSTRMSLYRCWDWCRSWGLYFGSKFRIATSHPPSRRHRLRATERWQCIIFRNSS